KHFRKEDISFPKSGRYKDEATFQAEFESTIKPLVAGRKGIAAFDKIFGFGGTGHVDLFDGKTLSDAPDWYPCEKLRIWYVVVPDAAPRSNDSTQAAIVGPSRRRARGRVRGWRSPQFARSAGNNRASTADYRAYTGASRAVCGRDSEYSARR